MALQSSGAIALDDMHVEAGGNSGSTCTVNDADIRGLIDASDGANTSFDDWYGAASAGDVVLVALGTATGTTYSNIVLQVSIATNGQDSDFGDLTESKSQMSAASSSTRGLFCGGYSSSISGGRSIIIDYFTIASAGNATDFGDLSQGNSNGAGASNNTRAIFKIGYSNSTLSNNIIEYVTIANTGNSTDFGDRTIASYSVASTSNTTRACFAGGNGTSIFDVIDYVTIANTGNATDFGNLTTVRQSINRGNVSTGTYGFFTGGNYTGVDATQHVDYITIASTGNASDFGELNREIRSGFQSGNKVKGLAGTGLQHDKGNESSNRVSKSDEVSVFTLGTSGSGSDWGDLTVGGLSSAGLSDDHGGIA